ncbi:S-layer homology domain-containing protein [Macellibacteroides fermentans]|uniref:S-layer homology domain-containing protein n=1 Tax=Macellibacteroides fermentans TaxID=879969 RepID=UPI00406BF1BE
MKMRKIISFVLVLSLVLGSFSMAFAATPATSLSDIAGTANEEAIQVNNDLGIITGFPDGTFLPEKAVTRAEFAAMITRAMAIPESALAGYSATSFKDMSGYGWATGYIGFCASKGIMLGDGQGNAMPGRTINVNEAMTMVLRAVGYVNHSSELVGTWPANYVTVAQNAGLYDDVAAVATVDRASAAQIIYNALTVQKVAVNADGETKGLTVGTATPAVAATLLNTGLNCDDTVGTIFGTEDSVINLNKYLGQHGTIYTNTDDEVVAFVSDSTQLIGKIDGTDFKTTVDSVKYTTTGGVTLAKLQAGQNFINGEIDNTTMVGAGKELVINVKLSGKTIVEVYSALEWTISDADLVAASDLKDIKDDQSLFGFDFVLDDDDEIDMTSFALVGVASLDDIKVDNVVYVYANTDGISRIEVGTKTVEGKVTSFLSDTNFVIAGTKYANATAKVNGVTTTYSTPVTASHVTKEVKAYLDSRGYVFEVKDLDGGAEKIAVVDAYAQVGFDAQVKLFTAEGNDLVAKYDDTKISSLLAPAGTLIGYGLNKDGKVTSANTNDTGTVALNFASNKVVTVGTTDRVISSDVVVFTVDAAGDYDVTTIDKVDKNKAIATGAALYKSATDYTVIAVIVPAANAKAASDNVYAVVNDLYVADYDGDPVDRLVGFADGAAMDKIADGKYLTYAPPSKSTDPAVFAAAVNLYKIEMDATGLITSISSPIVTNATDKTEKTAGMAVTAADGRSSVTVSGGAIYALATNVVVYEVNSDGDYKVFTGDFRNKDVVVLYELDDDADGYDLVVVNRADR